MGGGHAVVALAFVVLFAGCAGSGPVWIDIQQEYAVNHTDVRILNGCEYEENREVRFSNEAEDWTGWDGFVPERSWELSEGDGEKRVHIECRAGNASGNDFDTVILDTTPPTIEIERPEAGTVYAHDEAVTRDPLDDTRILGEITVEVGVSDAVAGVDAVSGVDSVEIWIDDSREVRETFPRADAGEPETIEWTWDAESQLTEFGPGAHELRIVSRDHAGNEAVETRTVVVVAESEGLPVG